MIVGISSFVAGAAVGSGVATFVAVLVVGLILSDFWRVRDRLDRIRSLASQQNEAMQMNGARRGAPDGEHWCELVAEIQPYEVG